MACCSFLSSSQSISFQILNLRPSVYTNYTLLTSNEIPNTFTQSIQPHSLKSINMRFTTALFLSGVSASVVGSSYDKPSYDSPSYDSPSNETDSYVTYTEVVSKLTTVCPSATEIVHNQKTYTVTTSTTLTITDCPCTLTHSTYVYLV